MNSMKSNSSKVMLCPHCGKDVVPVVKMFNTRICPKCNIILSSDRGIDKAGI